MLQAACHNITREIFNVNIFILVKTKGVLVLLPWNRRLQGREIATWRKEKMKTRNNEGTVVMFKCLVILANDDPNPTHIIT